MHFLKLIILLVAAFASTVFAKDEASKNRDKRQQIAFYPRRGAKPPPYAVQMEPIVQYSQRDPLYNPLASSKSDDLYEESPLNYYPTEPEPIIEIIIKESNESLPTPVPPPPPPSPRPTKEPIQVFYVKYEKKKGYGDKPRVVYDPPVPALTPVEEHEEIKPDNAAPYPEEPVHAATPAPTEPSTTLRAIIRPDSEVYHSGSSGIRVSFGTEQLPPNNHNKRSDLETPSTQRTKPSSVVSTPPGSPKRQHGPYQPIQPVHQRVPPAFPQQRIVNSFPPQQTLHQSPQQQPPLNFLPHQQTFPSPPQIRNTAQRPQRLPITVQGLPDVQQRAPFNNFGPPHRVSINHPQQPGFPPTLSVSHQSVQIQNQPLPINQGNHFNAEPQQQQPLPPYKQQELEKQRYHEQRRQQELLKQREHQRQHEQQQRHQEQQRYLEQQRQIEQHRQAEQHRQVEQHRQAEHQRQIDQQRILEQQRQQEHLEHQRLQEQQRLQEHQKLQEQQRLQEHQKLQEQQRLQEHQKLQEQQRLQEQRRRKQEQEQKHLQEQQYRAQLKYNQPQTAQPLPQIPLQPQLPKSSGEIFKAVPKLEQHYSIRENPLHPGPFPPNPIVQPTGFPEISQSQYPSPQPLNTLQESQQRSRNPPNQFINDQQQYLNAKQQTFSNHQQPFYSQTLPTSQPQRLSSSSSQRQSVWGRPSFSGTNTNPSQKIYATPVSTSEDHSPSSTIKPLISSTTASTTTTTTTEATTTTISPKNEAKIKENIANLPDEVPDDIREQLLSSGILGNADIQILDYDKVGDIPIEKLPPEALANFYGAGGASAVAASEPVPSIAKHPKTAESTSSSSSSSSTSFTTLTKKATGSLTKIEQATLRPGGVEMKVVRFDPNTEQGQAVADQHIRDDATRLKPVAVGPRDEAQYNRYLPLKVSGASFPIPDVPQLNGRKISSVVVLAPVDYNFQEEKEIESRQGRKVSDVQAMKFLAGDTLKQLVKKPTVENYEKWLEQESRTEPQKQAVVLLVTMPKDAGHGDREIFMYDVTSQSVSKLSGDLSTAFVDAAESNSDSTDSFDDSSFTSY